MLNTPILSAYFLACSLLLGGCTNNDTDAAAGAAGSGGAASGAGGLSGAGGAQTGGQNPGGNPGGGAGGPAPSCPVGASVAVVSELDMSAKCVRTETNQVVGCGAAPQGGEFSRYCWRDASSKRNYLANLPLGSLASPGAGWESCDADLQAFVGSDQVLACSNDCERFRATSCTPEDTCTALACGSHSSPYRADGCKRAKGAPCQADTDCGQQELCGVLSVFAGVNCGYLADGTCNCAGVIDGAVGPTGVCVAQ